MLLVSHPPRPRSAVAKAEIWEILTASLWERSRGQFLDRAHAIGQKASSRKSRCWLTCIPALATFVWDRPK